MRPPSGGFAGCSPGWRLTSCTRTGCGPGPWRRWPCGPTRAARWARRQAARPGRHRAQRAAAVGAGRRDLRAARAARRAAGRRRALRLRRPDGPDAPPRGTRGRGRHRPGSMSRPRRSAVADAGLRPADVAADGRPVVLAVGRLAAQKGFDTLIAAAARWRGRRPEPLLVIAGAGPLAGELSGQAAELGVDVRFLGSRDDVPGLLAAADVLALPSRWEGQPLILPGSAASGPAGRRHRRRRRPRPGRRRRRAAGAARRSGRVRRRRAERPRRSRPRGQPERGGRGPGRDAAQRSRRNRRRHRPLHAAGGQAVIAENDGPAKLDRWRKRLAATGQG